MNSGDHMKFSRKILGTFAVILTAACGVGVDKNDIHKIDEASSAQPLGEGFDLSGTDVSSLGSASNLNASSNLLECTPGAGGDGIVTNTVNYDLTGGEVTIKIDLTNTTSGHGEKISLISSTGDDYHFTIFDAGGYGYQAKASKNSDGFNWHRDFGVGNSVGYLRFKHDTTFNQMRLGFSTTGTFDPAIYMPYSVTSPTNFKLEFRCDDTLGSRISDLVINGDQLDLSLGGGTPPPSGSENVIWLKPGSLPGNGAAISSWTDEGDGAIHNASGSGPVAASNAINGQKAAYFDGSDDYMWFSDHTDINMGGPFEDKVVAVAFKTSGDISSKQVIYEQGGSTRGLNIYLLGNNLYFSVWNRHPDAGLETNNWGHKSVSAPIQANKEYVAVLEYSGSNGFIKGYLQGQLVGQTTGVGSLFQHADDSAIGGVRGSTYYHDNSTTNAAARFQGYVSEFIKYNSAVPSSELTTLIAQLTSTYIPSGVPANFAFHLKADEEVTSSAGLVSSWGDISANNLNANQGNSGLQPATGSSINGQPALNFDGDKLIIGNNGLLNVSGPYSQKTMSIAFRTSNDISSNQLLYEQGGGTRGLAIYISGGKVYFNIWNKANDGGTSASYFNPVYLSQDISPNTDYVVTGLYEFGGRKMEMRVNDSGLISNTQGDTRFGQLYNHGADVSIGGSASVVLHNNTYVTNGMYFTGTIAEMVYYNSALSAADSLALHDSLKQKYGASGSNGGGPGSGPYTLNNAQQNTYLGYVETYIDNQTRDDMWGGKKVLTYDNPGHFAWSVATDTYDNALASIFFTVIGKPQKAARILDTWIRMQNYEITTNNTPMFYARFNHWDNSPVDLDSWGTFWDAGNNSMMALAMCRYYQQFKDDAPNATLHKNYYNAANAIMIELHDNFKCNSGTYRGYMGRPTTPTSHAQHGTWLSVEHNLDIYALGACMQDAALTAETSGVNTYANTVKTEAGKFVDQMWDASEGAYRVGTAACGPDNQTNEDYKPVDGITWRHLSRAAETTANHNARSTASMATLVTDQFLVLDAGFTSEIGTNYWGTKFSDAGWENQYDNPKPAILSYGAQQENTGAALLALNDYHGNNYNADVEKIRTGVKAMLEHYATLSTPKGVPAHFDTDISACVGDSQSPQFRYYCNTGLGWSYGKTPHTAATAAPNEILGNILS